MINTDASAWTKAKNEARDVLIRLARRKKTTTYGELVTEIKSLSLLPHDPRLFLLLGEIGEAEHATGRPILTALVVHQGDGQPGEGFYKLAQALGQDTSEDLAYWIAERDRVWDHWKRR